MGHLCTDLYERPKINTGISGYYELSRITKGSSCTRGYLPCVLFSLLVVSMYRRHWRLAPFGCYFLVTFVLMKQLLSSIDKIYTRNTSSGILIGLSRHNRLRKVRYFHGDSGVFVLSGQMGQIYPREFMIPMSLFLSSQDKNRPISGVRKAHPT